MLFTVVTVTRNDYSRLNKTLNSLKSYYQYTDFEHIIIDGASTDKSITLIKSYATEYSNIKFVSEEDEGIYDAMNKGILLSHGDFILFLNAGDQILISPNTLMQKISRLTSTQIDIICFSFVHNWDDFNIVRNPQKINSLKMPTSHQGMLFSKDFLSKNKYDTSYKVAADFDFYLRADPKRITLFNNVTPLSIVEGDGIASSQSLKSYSEYCKIIIRKYGLIKSLNCITYLFSKLILVSTIKALCPNTIVLKIRKIYYTKKL